VEAAYALIADRGYPGVTMGAVAAAAGVSVQAVYFFFQNKLGLFRAAWQHAVFGAEERPPREQAWFRRMLREDDPRRAIQIAIDAAVAINRRLAPLEAVLEVYASDRDLAEFRTADEQIRLRGFRDLLEALAQKSPFRDGLTLDDAAVILMTVNSPSSYRMAVSRLGWDEKKYSTWVANVVTTTIFGLSTFVRDQLNR